MVWKYIYFNHIKLVFILNLFISAESNIKSNKTNRPDMFVTPARTHGFLKSLDGIIQNHTIIFQHF